MCCNSEDSLKRLSEITSTISSILTYDPQLLFVDTFESIHQQFNNFNEFLSSSNFGEKDYYIIYDAVISLLPILEKLIFFGYSDQILEFLLLLNGKIGSNFLFCTSRFIPLRLQLFTIICSAFANTEETREKDADTFIQSFKGEIKLLKQLEESNVNGLTETVTLCNNQKVKLSELFSATEAMIDLMNVHFNISSVKIPFESAKPPPANKKGSKQPPKEETEKPPEYTVYPQKTIQLIINAFNSPLPKGAYNSKYGQIVQSWLNPECQLAPSFLHRLIFSFLKAGNTVDSIQALVEARPDDHIVQLASAVSNEKWLEISDILTKLTVDDISTDFQFFNEVSSKLLKRYINGQIKDPSILKGVLHVFVDSPSQCPIQTSLVALHYCWFLDSQEQYKEAISASESALNVVETFRDFFSTRKSQKIFLSTKIPKRTHDQCYLSFEKWLESIHTDLVAVWMRSKLKFGFQSEVEIAKTQYDQEIEATMNECIKTKQLYGMLSQKQQHTFDTLVNRPFKPPIHSESAEQELLTYVKSNNSMKAILYIQMAFFRPQKAAILLERARQCMTELEAQKLPFNTPVIYITRTEIAFLSNHNIPGAQTVAMYGKEIVGSSGLTTQNTALCGTGVKQEQVEPFVVTRLKKNTIYSFAFGSYDSSGELIDNLTEPFTVTTGHPLSNELIWSYIASASYQLSDMTSFDISLTYLLDRYTDVCDVMPDHQFHWHLNPFNRFLFKPGTFHEPAPLLRAFSSALLMAARLFSSKPMHATSFQKLALILSLTLGNYDMVLKICNEMFAVIQPLLANYYETSWVIHPLLYINEILKNNKSTADTELHQNLLARCTYALDSILVKSYQERQLSVYVLNSAFEMKPNRSRTELIAFASKDQILETKITEPNNNILVVASELFKNNPEKSFDELFNKYKADPDFVKAAVFLISSAHNVGLCLIASNWCNLVLDYLRTNLHSLAEEKPAQPKVTNSRSPSKMAQNKKRPSAKGKKNEPPKPTEEEIIELNAVNKIRNVWNRYKKRRNNLAKFNAVNNYRAAINLLLAMCLIENDTQMVNAVRVTESVRIAPPTVDSNRPNQKSRSRQNREMKATASSVESNNKNGNDDNEDLSSYNIVNFLRRAIVLGNRSNDNIVVHSAVIYSQIYLVTVFHENLGENQKTLSSSLQTLITVITRNTDIENIWTQKLLKEMLVLMINDDQHEKAIKSLVDSCNLSSLSGQHIWLLEGKPELEIPDDLKKANEIMCQRDPAENIYFNAKILIKKSERSIMFPNDSAANDVAQLVKSIYDSSISLQRKQHISMSISLLSHLAFHLLNRGETQLALSKLCEALECHFCLVKAHEKVDTILKTETEETFFKKHSWSGCLSIFVIASLISLHTEQHDKAIMLTKLSAFAISALFSSSSTNPKKQIDFAEFEPTEIIPGHDIFFDLDSHQPLLEPPSADIINLAISNLLSSMLTFELFIEMFKPLSFARHFFRYIVREKRCLARSRLMTVIACSHFGILSSAMKALNDVLTSYGESRITKESSLYSPKAAANRIAFDVNNPSSSPSNIDAIRQISNVALLDSITNQYGFSLCCLYTTAISRVLQCVASCSEPTGISFDPNSANVNTRKHKGSRPTHHKKDSSEANSAASSTTDAFDFCLKSADQILSVMLSKDFRADQLLLKLELSFEQATLYMMLWRWEDAISIANNVIKASPVNQPISTSFINRPSILASGLIDHSRYILANASYNLHDYLTAEKYGTPYMQGLLLIHKADYEGAALLFSQIMLHKPITLYYKEYVLAVAQLITLFNNNNKLIDIVKDKVGHDDRNLIQPLELITNLNESTFSFFIEELALNEERSYFLCDTHLLVRLKLLEAVTNINFKGSQNPIEILADAQTMMANRCPFISHGLSFLLNATCSRYQMQNFLSSTPTLIQYWNQEVNPLIGDLSSKTSPEFVEKMTLLLHTMFSQAPDCVVHPASQQSILDFAILAGVASEDNNKRLEHSLATLSVAHAVRSSRRFVQSLIAQSPDTPPVSCPTLLLNENKGQKLRGIAAAYYAHVCGLDLPIFDSENLELRTLLFFKCFEEQCASFKSLQQQSDQITLDAGQIVGQWYKVDAKIFGNGGESGGADGTTTVTGTRASSNAYTMTTATSTMTGTTRTSTTTSGKKKKSAVLRGSLFFFIGIVVDLDESAKKKPKGSGTPAVVTSSDQIKLTPIMLAAQNSDLRSTSNEMAEIGLQIDEAVRMESPDFQGDGLPPPKDASDAGSARKKPPPPQKKGKNGNEGSQASALLKNQIDAVMKNAEIKWNVTLHKAETIFNKSNRIVGYLVENRNRWPTEVKMNGIEMSNSQSLSHFFNCQYGINEKAPQLAEWLVNCCSTNAITGQKA